MRSAHCPLRPGHCPLRQRIVRMPITPPQCGLSPERNAPPCCLLRAPHYRSQLCALRSQRRTAALSSALSAPLSARRSQRCALSAALSSSRSPPLPAMTTTYAPRAARVCLPALNLSQGCWSTGAEALRSQPGPALPGLSPFIYANRAHCKGLSVLRQAPLIARL